MSYRSDADPPPTQHLINELGDRFDRIEHLRDEWVAGAQTGREMQVRITEVVDLAARLADAQAADDMLAAAHATALRQAGGVQ
ncbi:hypothetical protein [Streptomonospora arabica]|uniref:WXG100 family type VII secretion target n=1 Tax=Streptomonospora arabica TaxID=412417 RepID=A0ABV9SSE6_9ACTN